MNQDLGILIGETIIDVEVVDYDQFEDGERVDELYRITLASGKVLHFLCDGGDCSHYGTISPVTIQDEKIVDRNYEGQIGTFKSLKNER